MLQNESLPVRSYRGKKLLVSADGSATFYNTQYQQSYRALSTGAFTESLVKFFLPSKLMEKRVYKDLRILDICFGLGYNCAVAFEYLSRLQSPHIVHIVSIDKDESLTTLLKSLTFLFPTEGYRILKECIALGRCGTFSLELYIRDALEAVEQLQGSFDAIFFDPFSMAKNPEMWSVELFKRLRELLSVDGCLLSYASGKKVRLMMQSAGLKTADTQTARNAFMPGTIALR
ncbi:MAG: hypothetical protein LBP51_03345 [Deferribacteraceae bacterium]|jgi:chorismate dehydratase|nr:hypothetical protein [Deferribacteraceae bacterium]